MRQAIFVLAVCGVLAAALAPPGYVYTPAGLMRKECVHAVPHESVIAVTETHTEVTTLDGTLIAKLPLCEDGLGAASSGSGDDDLPSDYDGWLEYAAFQDTKGLDVFLGSFSVPDLPAATPAVLYLFTGLQNINWIPKVDPEPSVLFDIIQPVLQYPGDNGNYWSVKSWYVTLKGGAFYSTELPVQPGDKIFGNMTRIGPSSYFIDSVSTDTGKHTSLVQSNSRLTSQPWAYVTLECYGCEDCSTYPKLPSYFTEMSMELSGHGGPVTPKWQANPKPAKDRKCKESIDIQSPQAVTIGFQ